MNIVLELEAPEGNETSTIVSEGRDPTSPRGVWNCRIPRVVVRCSAITVPTKEEKEAEADIVVVINRPGVGETATIISGGHVVTEPEGG